MSNLNTRAACRCFWANGGDSLYALAVCSVFDFQWLTLGLLKNRAWRREIKMVKPSKRLKDHMELLFSVIDNSMFNRFMASSQLRLDPEQIRVSISWSSRQHLTCGSNGVQIVRIYVPSIFHPINYFGEIVGIPKKCTIDSTVPGAGSS